jgi:hypothetical protein
MFRAAFGRIVLFHEAVVGDQNLRRRGRFGELQKLERLLPVDAALAAAGRRPLRLLAALLSAPSSVLRSEGKRFLLPRDACRIVPERNWCSSLGHPCLAYSRSGEATWHRQGRRTPRQGAVVAHAVGVEPDIDGTIF